MKKTIRELAIFSFSVFFATLCAGQAAICYVVKQEPSGFDVTPYQDTLEQKACELLTVLPDPAYSDSFKVFSFGFYVGMELYRTYTYPQAFLDMKEQVAQESPYYLLIGRQSDLTGIFTKFWVDVKLPDAGHFPCITPQKAAEVRQLVQYAIDKAYAAHGNYHGSYAEAEKAGIEKFNKSIDKLVNCCQGNKPEKMSGLCEEITRVEVEDQLNAYGFFNYNTLEIVQLTLGGNNEVDNLVFKLNERCALNGNSAYSTDGSTYFNLIQEIADFKSELESIDATHDIQIIYLNDDNASDIYSMSYPINTDEDYFEEIYVLDFGGPIEVYFRFSFAHSDKFEYYNFEPGSDPLEKSAGISAFAKRAVRWFVKRAATSPQTVLIGIAVDYAVSGLVEFWFNPECHDDLLGAFVNVIKQRGLTGFAISVVQNALDSPAVDFLATFANYFITTPYEEWDPYKAFLDASLTTVVRSFIDIAYVKGLGFTKIGELISDIGTSGKGFDLIKAMLSNRNVVTSWKGLADRPMWIRMNTDLLKKLTGENTAFIKKVNDFYASTSHKLPSGWKNDPTLKLPKTYLGIEFNKFGFPNFKGDQVASPVNKVEIEMMGNHSASPTGDYGKAKSALELELRKTDSNAIVTNDSPFTITYNGQTSATMTWHHMEDGKTMQAIKKEWHDKVSGKHTGGNAFTKPNSFFPELKGFFE